MKKSVVILIALIYVASIALVGFLGLKAKSYNDVIYIESIQILNDYKINKAGDKYITFKPANSENKSLQLECRVTPDNASDKKIVYSLLSSASVATVDENGLVRFADGISKTTTVTVGIYSNQDRTKSDKIAIIYIPAS